METSLKNFDEEVLKSKIPVMVDFWSSWCVPCKSMEPILSKLEVEYNGKMKICKVNTDKNRSLAHKYEIKGLPTFLFFKDSKVIRREVAAKPASEMRRIFDEFLKQ